MAIIDYPLQTLSNDGSPPARRLKNASDAQSLFRIAWDRYNTLRGPINAKVQGALDGNAPYNQKRLDAEGLGWTANVNFRLLEADVNQAAIPLYMLFADVPSYIQVDVEIPKVPANENRRVGEVISQEHRRLMKKWAFDFEMQLGIRNRCAYGYSNLYFPDKRDFRFRAAPQATVFVPDGASQDISKLPWLAITYDWQVTELFHAIESPDAEKVGWNVGDVRKALINRLNETSGYKKSSSWEYWQEKIRDHEAYLSEQTPTIQTAWIYTAEFSGKISRSLIFSDDFGAPVYLFDRTGEFDNWQQIIHPMFAEIGNGDWNGVKSIAVKAFNFRDAQNRLHCRMLDAAMIGSTVLFQAEDAAAAEAFQMVQLGPNAVIDKKITPMQMPLLTQLDKPLAINNSLERTLQNNIGGIRGGLLDVGGRQPISATEAQISATSAQGLTIAEQTRWLEQLDYLYTEQMRRLAERPVDDSYEWEKLVREFHERCEKRGVPKKAWNHIIEVKATRTIGRGSELMKQQMSMQLYKLLRSDPNVPKGVLVRHLRHTSSNLVGREYLDQIWPEEEIEVSPTKDENIAQTENAGMLLGVPPIRSNEENPLAHAVTHLQFLAEKVGALQQGQMDPQGYLTLAGVALPHTAETLDSMTGDEVTGSMKQQLFNAYTNIVAQTKKIGEQFQEMQQAQAEQQQQAQAQMMQAQMTGQLMDPESQVKMAKVQADAQLSAAKLKADMTLKAAKQQATQQLKNRQVMDNTNLKRRQVEADIALKAATATAPQNTR